MHVVLNWTEELKRLVPGEVTVGPTRRWVVASARELGADS